MNIIKIYYTLSYNIKNYITYRKILYCILNLKKF